LNQCPSSVNTFNVNYVLNNYVYKCKLFNGNYILLFLTVGLLSFVKDDSFFKENSLIDFNFITSTEFFVFSILMTLIFGGKVM
jgi:hypothetical protein